MAVVLGFPTSFKSSPKFDWSFHSTGTPGTNYYQTASANPLRILAILLASVLLIEWILSSWWNVLAASRNLYKKSGTALDPSTGEHMGTP